MNFHYYFLIKRRSDRKKKITYRHRSQDTCCSRALLCRSSGLHWVFSPSPGFHMIQYVWDWTTQGSRQSFSNLQATTVWEKNLRRDEGILYLEGRESTRVKPKPSLNVRQCLKWRIMQWPRRRAWLHFACVEAKAFTSVSNSSAGFCNTFSCLNVKYDFISGIHLFYMRGEAVGDPRQPALFPQWLIRSSCLRSGGSAPAI